MSHKHHRIDHRGGLGPVLAKLALQIAAGVVSRKLSERRSHEPPSGGKAAKRT